MDNQAKNTHKTSYIECLMSWLILASSFILGISFGYNHQWFILVGFAIVCSIAHLRSIKAQQLMFCIALFAIGYTRLQIQHYFHKSIAQSIQGKTVNIKTRIVSIEPVQHTLYRYAILVDVYEHESDNSKASHQSWRLQCYTKQKPNYMIGDKVLIKSVKIAKKPNNSFASYLIKEGIHGTTFLRNNTTVILDHSNFNLKREISRFKHKILRQLRSKCSRTTFTLLSSIFLGNRTIIKKQYQKIKDLFCHWGIVHYLARSGIHLIIFILLLQLALQWAPIPLKTKLITILLVTGLYTLLTWSSVSFARAYASFLWYKLCHIFGLQINMIYIVLMLICLFLFINPSLLFFLDFQLSFGLTLLLAIVNNQLAHQKLP